LQATEFDCLIENLYISPLTVQVRYVPCPSDTLDPVSSNTAAFFEAMDEIQDQHLYSLR
jgi:hypothetical protein